MYQAGLILEGGGMKGMFTCGVHDFFMDRGLLFSSCYGVSAGACHMCSYLSGQRGRAYHVAVDYLECRDYCSLHSLLFTGDLFNRSVCYDLIPHYLNPYDYRAYARYEGKAYAVATDIVSGEPAYLELKDMETDIEAVRASSSLPLVSRNVKIGGRRYLDGGLSDSIPIARSIRDGNRKNIVVLTKETGYRKERSGALPLIRAAYLRYPKVYELMKNRHISYNRTLDYLKEQERCGRAFVIQPETASGIGRIEKDKEKLTRLYEIGYQEAQRRYEALMEYLKE